VNALDIIYVFDTSSFIELKKFSEYSDILVSLWSNLEHLAMKGRLISPKKVLEDLIPDLEKPGTKNDELVAWAKNHNTLFQDEEDLDFLKALAEITNKYKQTWVDIDSEKNQSDPYVVALAVSRKKKQRETLIESEIVVVTEESQDFNRLKIPKVCNDFGIRCVNLHQFFKEEGWKF